MRVLVCDDEQIIRKLIELSFRGTQHQLRTVAGGEEALEVMREWTPDVLFTDVIMPRMDGFRLARAVRSDPRLKDLPIVFMTASVRVEEIGDSGVGGPTAYLSKPFGPGALRDVLASLERGGSPGSAAS